MYVCLSVRFRRKRDFLGPYIRQSSHFLCAHSSCIRASILQIFCLSFCRSGYKRQKSFATMLSSLLGYILASCIYVAFIQIYNTNTSKLDKFISKEKPLILITWIRQEWPSLQQLWAFLPFSEILINHFKI